MLRCLVPTLCLALIGALLATGCSPDPLPAPGDRRNVILIVVDTLRRDHLSSYGAPFDTPHLDRLAEEGQAFENAVASFHQTTMSMAALFTGRTPSLESHRPEETVPWTSRYWCGMARFSGEAQRCVPHGLTTLAEDLRAAGYHTIGVVSNYLLFRPYGYDQGFDEWIEVQGEARGPRPLPVREQARQRRAEIVNAEALAALGRRPARPFFLYLHYLDVHDFAQRGRSYAESVQAFDARLGELRSELSARGLLAGTTVFVGSDHGEMLKREHLGLEVETHYGNPSFEPLLRVPLIVWPEFFEDTRELVRSEDLRDLVREVAGLGPAGVAGPLAPGELYVGETDYQTYRDERWKSLWQRGSERRWLFDLHADPHETQDLSAEHPEILERHRRRIAELAEALHTPSDGDGELSAEDRARLRALGYLD